MQKVEDKIYYVGVNDREKHLFENLWPLPHGVSYNSYLILDDKTALVDTVDICYSDRFLQQVEILLDGRKLDYLIINHMEPDHSGSIRLLKQKYPDVILVGTPKAFDMINGFFGAAIADNKMEVKDGHKLSLGEHQLTFYTAPMVHWPEVMFTYDETVKLLFSADAFGTFGTIDGGVTDEQIDTELHMQEMYRYYSNIVGKYGNPVQKALSKLASIEVKTICSTHGPIWKKRMEEAVSIYDRLSRYEAEEGVVIAYGSMYGNTEQMAEAIAEGCVAGGIHKVILHSVSKSHQSYILSDIFRYKGLILGSPTYSNVLYPGVESLLSKIVVREIRNRYLGLFGSFTWAGAAARHLQTFSENSKMELISNALEIKQSLSQGSYAECVALGKRMAECIKG
ncbi:MAG: FprA family A-type flavoprotein [Bacteroidales bacterium]|nr:FprA family A-type flavoprotein [Bacteroidales bacterium]